MAKCEPIESHGRHIPTYLTLKRTMHLAKGSQYSVTTYASEPGFP